MDPYGVSNTGDPYGAGGDPYGVRAAPIRIPLMPPPVPVMPRPMPMPVPQTMFGTSGLLGPIGGPRGVGASLPSPTVIPYKPQGQGTGNAPVVGKDIPLAKLVEIQRKAESSGNYQAINREAVGNTASGAYQYTDRTWNNYGGYPKAALAPKEVQDRRFSEDIAARVNKFNGDVFRTIAAHYLPAAANNPAVWDKPYTIRTKRGTTTVRPVATYLRHVFKGTPFEGQIDAYIAAHK